MPSRRPADRQMRNQRPGAPETLPGTRHSRDRGRSYNIQSTHKIKYNKHKMVVDKEVKDECQLKRK